MKNNYLYPNNEDNSKTYVCYTQDSSNAFCYYFNSNSREFSEIHSFGHICRRELFFIKLNASTIS